MSQPIYVYQNGKIVKEENATVSINNRSFRYGDGCFETLKLINGKIQLEAYHFDRLFTSLQQLQFNVPNYLTAPYLAEQIQVLAKKNNHQKLARVRLTMYRGEGGLYDVQNNFPYYTIQTWALNPANNELNENGLVIDFFEAARKVVDSFANIKSNNYLCYVMAALWAKENHLNDVLLLNPYQYIADATIANIFIVKDNIIYTPPLSDGCINGIMRKHLITCCKEDNNPIVETSLTVEHIKTADEVFLTNSIYGIRWVKQFGETVYTTCSIGAKLYKQYITDFVAS